MRIDVVTIFSEFFESALSVGLVGKALESGIATVDFIDPREFTSDRHRTVDDAPYGGGAGMVMKVEPLVEAIERARSNGPGPVLLLSPQGRPLRQRDLARWSAESHLTLVAGRYEGFDERVRSYVDEEISIGDFVLTGGEYGAAVIIDGVVRLLPGTVGNEASPEHDSFAQGLLEHPHYTRPPEYLGARVPEVLLSGHHGKVADWRKSESLRRTRWRRPELLEERAFDYDERRALEEAPSAIPPIHLAVSVGLETHAAFVDALFTLALAYDVARVHLVATDPAVKARLDAELEACDARWIPAVRPPPRRRRDPIEGERIDPKTRIEVLPSWDALPSSTAASLLLRVGCTRAPRDDLPVAAPGEVLERARQSGRGICLVIAPRARITPDLGLELLLPAVRVGAKTADFSPLLLATVLLDRLIAEG